MATLTAEVTKEIKQLTKEILKSGLYKSQSEVVRDAIRQLALKYEVKSGDIKNVRKIVAKTSKKSGRTLSETVKELRRE
ncbi:MAG: hypothetical protein HY051_01215 [Candidatus Aenigmarchaeota archaeon]|nr:hypothetical protein [Candidatus Aenigmarchaeota archaeon]